MKLLMPPLSLPLTDLRNPPRLEQFVRCTRIEASAEEVYRWHAEPGALQRLTPPWEPVEVLADTAAVGGLAEGTEVTLQVRIGPAAILWVSRLSGVQPGRGFRDTQIRGPFAFWEHSHQMIPDTSGSGAACFLEDSIRYALPLGALGRLVGGRFVRAKLERLFAYRHRVTREAFL
jgi:ligand-binding SRPBCC domain-containing protein